MDVRITETGVLESITLIDPKSGCCWFADAIGGCDDLQYNDETEEYEMSQDAFDWWSDYAAKKEAADYAYYEALQNANNEERERIIDAVDYAQSQVNDIIDGPAAIMTALEEFNA